MLTRHFVFDEKFTRSHWWILRTVSRLWMNVISCSLIGQDWEQFSERQNILSFQLKSAFSTLTLHSVYINIVSGNFFCLPQRHENWLIPKLIEADGYSLFLFQTQMPHIFLLYTEIPHQLLSEGKPRVWFPVSVSVLSLKSLGKKCLEQQKLFLPEVK